ncbi:MAG: hypothetical protein IIA87_04220 [Nanoarchaeota archaeon]|nr:hypothetical protein [Nanoarchaeota archaeon]
MKKGQSGGLLVTLIIVIVILGVIVIWQSNKFTVTGNVIREDNPSQQETATVTCNNPYIKVGNSCCLDQNSNNICDNDEIIEQEPTNNVWKELYESECYGKDNLISKSQAENIAKHYAMIQTNNNAKNPVSKGDIKTTVPTSTIGEKCNPDWFISLELDYMDKYDDQITSRYFIIVSGEMVNETLQGATFLPNDYVFKKVEAELEYHTKSSNMLFVGESHAHYSPFSNIP